MSYIVHFSCATHIGKCRSKNEDNYCCVGNYIDKKDCISQSTMSGFALPQISPLFAVFDGLGGEEHGEIASFLAAREAARLRAGRCALQDLCGYCVSVNAQICAYADRNSISSMGTTVAMMTFRPHEVVLCNLGDSKIFVYAHDTLEQISHDHVTVAPYGAKPPLLQYLGVPSNEFIIRPYLARGRYRDGDTYLLCSDGLTDMVRQEDISKVLRTVAFSDMADSLLELALENGGRDNITILLCRTQRKSRRKAMRF